MNKGPGESCSECVGLKNGTRSNQDPHEYLVPSSRAQPDKPASYRCLLCQTELTCRNEGMLTQWR